MARTSRWMTIAALIAGLPLTLAADTLYLRNGTRVEGELIAVRGSTIEFEERRGFGGSRTIRVDRDEVDRIDFDRFGGGRGGNSAGLNGGRPGGMRERAITVSATEPWTDTGVQVRGGQTIYIEAFLTSVGPFVTAVQDAVEAETGRRPEASTTGMLMKARALIAFNASAVASVRGSFSASATMTVSPRFRSSI